MSGFLLDTNVLSESTKRHPSASVQTWLAQQHELWVSVLSIGELRRGATLLRARDAARSASLDAWIDALITNYGDRLLPVDGAVATAWGRLPTLRTLPVIDGLLAATAAAHGLTVATRNTTDFRDTGVATINPFTP